jgi:hypothetical protein
MSEKIIPLKFTNKDITTLMMMKPEGFIHKGLIAPIPDERRRKVLCIIQHGSTVIRISGYCRVDKTTEVIQLVHKRLNLPNIYQHTESWATAQHHPIQTPPTVWGGMQTMQPFLKLYEEIPADYYRTVTYGDYYITCFDLLEPMCAVWQKDNENKLSQSVGRHGASTSEWMQQIRTILGAQVTVVG